VKFTRENLEVTIKFSSLIETIKYLIIFILNMHWLSNLEVGENGNAKLELAKLETAIDKI